MWLRWIACMLVCLPAAAQVPPDPPPQKKLIGRVRYTVNGPFKLTDLVHLDRTGREIRVAAEPTPELQKLVQKGDSGLMFQGSGALWVAISRNNRDPWNSGVLTNFTLRIKAEPDASPQFRIASIEINPNYTRIIGRILGDEQKLQPELIIQPGNWRLQVIDLTNPQDPQGLVNETGRDGFDLLREPNRNMLIYGVPMLRELNGGKNPLLPGAADVYRAFDQLPADEADVSTLRAMLADLNSLDPVIREKAVASFSGAGSELIHAALRLDRKSLTPEQRLRVDQLLTLHSTYGPPETESSSLLQDDLFLILLRDHEDFVVQSIARTLRIIRQ